MDIRFYQKRKSFIIWVVMINLIGSPLIAPDTPGPVQTAVIKIIGQQSVGCDRAERLDVLGRKSVLGVKAFSSATTVGKKPQRRGRYADADFFLGGTVAVTAQAAQRNQRENQLNSPAGYCNPRGRPKGMLAPFGNPI